MNLYQLAREAFSKKVIFGPRHEGWEQSPRGGEGRTFQVKRQANVRVQTQEITHDKEQSGAPGRVMF